MLLGSVTARDLDRLTARVFECSGRSSTCRLDAYRIDENYFIDIELPGVDPADIDVTVDDNILTVRAARRQTESDEQQRTPGPSAEPLTRQIDLTERLDTDRLEARFDNGVLTLSIPLEAEAAANA
jgi:HSP20 family protein